MFSWEEKIILFIKRYYIKSCGVLALLLGLLVRVAIIRGQDISLLWYVNIHPLVRWLFASSFGVIIRYFWSVLDILIPILFFKIQGKRINVFLTSLFLFNPALILSSTFSGGIVEPVLLLLVLIYWLIKKEKKSCAVLICIISIVALILANVFLFHKTDLWACYIHDYYVAMINFFENHQLWTIVCSAVILLCDNFEDSYRSRMVPALCVIISTLLYANNMFNILRWYI